MQHICIFCEKSFRNKWEYLKHQDDCIGKELTILKQQRDDLLAACEFTLEVIDKSFSERAEAKARLTQAIADANKS